MKFRDYQQQAAKTAPRDGEYEYFSMKLAAESGEVIDLLAKFLYQGKPFDRAKINEELGDVLWSLCNLARVCGVDMDDCAASNLAKIQQRFPGRFAIGDLIREGGSNDGNQ